MRGNYRFAIDGYRSFNDIMTIELNTLKEVKNKYWVKALTPGILPEDRLTYVAVIMHLENEIMIREISIEMYCT